MIGVEREPAVLEPVAAGRMPFDETGTQELLERVARARQPRAHASRRTTPPRPTTSCSRSARPRTSHIEIDMSQIRQVIDDLLPLLREGHSLILRSTVAPGHHRVGRRLHRAAARLPRRRGPVRRARARADRREPLPRGDRHAAVHRRRRRRGLRRQGRRAVRGLRHRDRADHPGRRPSWRRSGPTSCATRSSRCPNLLMMECEQYGANVFEVIDLINHDYPRGGIARPGPHRRHLPAQGLRLLRGALERARHAAGRLARARDACRCSWSRA